MTPPQKQLKITMYLMSGQGIFYVFLFILLLYILYKVFQFVNADADLSLLGHSLKPGFFKDKVVWVTGASSGIGEELCRQLSHLQAKVILSARSEDKLQSVLQSLAHPERGRVLVVDLTDGDSLAEITEQAKALFGRIDVLVNNGGIASIAFFIDFSERAARQLFETNFLGTISLTRAVLKQWVDKREGGHVVNIASVAGKGGGIHRHYYGASKAALISLTDSLRFEFLDDNIHFTNILPGPVRTDVTINALTADGSKYGKMHPLIGNGMNVKRCCSLILVAVSNRIKEAWISTHPFLILTYLAQYMPSLQYVIMKRRVKKHLASIRVKKES